MVGKRRKKKKSETFIRTERCGMCSGTATWCMEPSEVRWGKVLPAVTIDQEYWKCTDCGHEYLTPRMMENNQGKMFRKYTDILIENHEEELSTRRVFQMSDKQEINELRNQVAALEHRLIIEEKCYAALEEKVERLQIGDKHHEEARRLQAVVKDDERIKHEMVEESLARENLIVEMRNEIHEYAYTPKGYDDALNGERLARQLATDALVSIANTHPTMPGVHPHSIARAALKTLGVENE